MIQYSKNYSRSSTQKAETETNLESVKSQIRAAADSKLVPPYNKKTALQTHTRTQGYSHKKFLLH